MEKTAQLLKRRHASWQRIGIAPTKFGASGRCGGAAAATAGLSAYQQPLWGRDEPDTRGVSRPGGLDHSVEGEVHSLSRSRRHRFDRLATGIRDVHSPLRGSALSSAVLQPLKELATSDMRAGPAYLFSFPQVPAKGDERHTPSLVSQQMGAMSCLICIMGYNADITVLCTANRTSVAYNKSIGKLRVEVG
ncbi:uncharacterized protein TRIVIDRAFT_206138 [Trichoderma virens Gv29-8]|uniref:Uncharacterized protein n=1 Tax=Hypocrea virens (strain Gv29-8 / FGSC 10586) TaxID=413071 RepID=G9N9A8_HYPVG|nr:uncharacterized protein TRIVIDRAFT_206138 [Trichoderma virens Gv29-8]EHK16529.1 hypothetical protein TRIVIDRAFT_206138 [Trichoderma virens Gv29-8]UKZ52092.1 hypothetical protein TrVGV298_005862 [Trichoderma virens]